jgi:hypothetical protein
MDLLMMSEFFRLLRYFTPRLLGFGLVLGTLFGALTYPILGGFVGAPWGLAGGLLLAIVLSIFMPIYERRYGHETEAPEASELVIAAGLVTTVVMAIPLLILYAPIAGLTAAYVVKGYTESPEYTGEKRKSSSQDPYQRRRGVVGKVVSEMMSQSRWVIILGTVLGMLGLVAYGIFDPLISLESALFGAPFFGIAGLIYGFVNAVTIASVNGLFVGFMNRLYFNEDTPKELYKRRIVPMVGLLTLFTSAIVTFGIGAPFASIAAALAAGKYADWYYEGEGEEKAKRGSRLEEGLEDEDELFGDEQEEKQLRG